MIRGILQFTPSIAFRYVLHRCESRDIRCRESYWLRCKTARPGPRPRERQRGPGTRLSRFLFPWRIPRRGTLWVRSRTGGAMRPGGAGSRGASSPGGLFVTDSRVVLLRAGFDNDPSAGSPTETLLRLLLPLNDKVQWTSRDVVGDEAPTSPRSEHFTGPFNR